MKAKLVRFLIVLCAALMIVCSVTACNNDLQTPAETTDETGGSTTAPKNTTAPDEDNGKPSESQTTEDPTLALEAREREEYAPKQKDFSGYIYRMVVQNGEATKWWGPTEDDTSVDVTNLALLARNNYLEEFFNIEISCENSSSDLAALMTTKDAAGDDYADVVLGSSGGTMPTAVRNGYVLNLKNVSGLNLEASYWDQRIQTEYSIDGMVFALEGDYNCWDDLRTHVILYNANLYRTYGYLKDYGTPYELVRNGNWTLDVMLAMFKDRSDINSKAELGVNDQWGLLSETVFPYVVFLGTGTKNVSVTRDGSLELLFADSTQYETTYNMFEDILKKISINDEVLFADSCGGMLGSDNWTKVSAMFEADQALFRSTTLSAATRLENMESTFGILPVPKYSEKQDGYYSWCSVSDPMMIPATALSHIEKTATITEALAHTSKYMPNEQMTCLEAFEENMSVVKLCRTAEDYEMLNLVMSNKTYDLDYAFGITGVYSAIQSASSNRSVSGLSSTLSSKATSAQKMLEKLLDNVASKTPNP